MWFIRKLIAGAAGHPIIERDLQQLSIRGCVDIFIPLGT
jgi:hypothetical protein